MFNFAPALLNQNQPGTTGGSLVRPDISYIGSTVGVLGHLGVQVSATRYVSMVTHSTNVWTFYLFSYNDGIVKLLHKFSNCTAFMSVTAGLSVSLLRVDDSTFFLQASTNTSYMSGALFSIVGDVIVPVTNETTLVAAAGAANAVAASLSGTATLALFHPGTNFLATQVTTLSSTTITPGTAATSTVAVLGAGQYLTPCVISSTYAVILYFPNSTTFGLVEATISGTTVTFGTPTTGFLNTTYGVCQNIIATSATSGFISYVSTTRGYTGFVPWSVSAGVFTLGTKVENFLGTTTAQSSRITNLTGTNFLWQYIFGTAQFKALVVSSNGTVQNTVKTIGGATGVKPTFAQLYPINGGTVLSQHNYGSGINKLTLEVLRTYGPIVT